VHLRVPYWHLAADEWLGLRIFIRDHNILWKHYTYLVVNRVILTLQDRGYAGSWIRVSENSLAHVDNQCYNMGDER
jgi:hypothetical protein